MFDVLMILIILVGILMTIVILMQSSKGQGLSGAFGGTSGVGSMLGVRRAADVLAKATWVLAGVFVVLVFAVNMFFLPSEETQESIITRQIQEQPMRMSAPQQDAQQAPAPAAPQQAPADQGN